MRSLPSGVPRTPSAAFLLQATGRIVREEVEAGLRSRGTSLRQVSALGHLRVHPGLSYSELARRAGITVQSMQATLAQLEAEHLVERRSPPGRGRAAVLAVTPAGERMLADAEAAIDAVDQRLFGGLPAQDRRALTDQLMTAFVEVSARRSRPESEPP